LGCALQLRLPALALLIAFTLPAPSQSLTAPPLAEAQKRALADARSAELRGDEFLAIEGYKSLLQSGRDAADVALRLSAIARARLGAAEGRTLLRALGAQNPAVSLAAASLADLSERRKTLESFVAAHPDYGPGHALLAREYRRDRIDEQPLRDRLREHELLGRFLALDAQGQLGASFIDAAVLATWLEQAERRVAALETSLSGAAAAVTADFSRSNSDWTIHLNMPEEPSEVMYRLGEGSTYRSTGHLPATDARTGRRIVATHFSLSLDTPAATILVKYRDLDGREAGPFRIAFDPHGTILQHARETLDADRSDWVAFTTGFTSDHAYFNTPMYSRCAIQKLEYGFNGPPNKEFPLPPCDFDNPSGTPADAQSAVKMEDEVRTVSVRITFLDGTAGTRTFRRPSRR
jgi:hypothetical protein